MDLNLSGKVALVTGGSTGIGLAISEGFAKEGCNLVIVYHSMHRKESTEKLIERFHEEYGVNGIAVQADTGEENDVKRIFDEAEEKLGGVDILVNNSGYLNKTSFLDITFEEWNSSFHNNTVGMMLMSKEYAKRRIEKGLTGRIVNTLSKVAILSKSKKRVCYTVAKDCELGLTRQTVVDLADKGIVANGVCVGLVKTDLNADDPLMAQKESRTPLKRSITTTEIANCVLFLASDASMAIAGAAVDLSQGMLLGF